MPTKHHFKRSPLKRGPAKHKYAKDPRKTLRKTMTTIFNKFIRLRDAHLPCISCQIRRVQEAGHYWPTSVCPQPSMRFNEENVNGQCTTCNGFQEGNRQGYMIGLVKKYGDGILDRLDIQKKIKCDAWQVFEYRVMISRYQQKVAELEGA